MFSYYVYKFLVKMVSEADILVVISSLIPSEFLKVQQLIDKQTKVKKNIINLSDSGTTAPPTTTSTTTAAETTSKAPGKY